MTNSNLRRSVTEIMIETKHLKIYPATQNQMEAFIAVQSNDILKAAYLNTMI